MGKTLILISFIFSMSLLGGRLSARKLLGYSISLKSANQS